MIRNMTQGEAAKHVFVSYVREDSDAVDSLCAVLEAAQIPYWRDREALGPGDAWKAKIREAIRDGSLVFLACFSDNSRAKDKSYMNEELTIAVEEFRKMAPGRTWLIPVRFDDGDVPEWDLGAGRVLSDFNYADLFGPGHMANAARLITTINRLLGEKRVDPATALAAVEQAADADRPDMLKRLTKEMVPDPARRIELDDLIAQEVQRVMAVLTDKDRVAGPMTGTNNEQVVKLAEEGRELWELVHPFCASLQVAARWGSPELLTPWANGIRSFVSATTRVESGVDGLLRLRHVPGVASIMTAAIACGAAGTWANLRTLIIDPSVRDKNTGKSVAMLQATDWNQPFATDWIAHTLARGTVEGKDFTEALEDFTERRAGKYHTPASEWLHAVLRSVFADQLPDQDGYDAEFDRAEVMVGMLGRDCELTAQAVAGAGEYVRRAYWVGRSTWRSQHWHGNPVEDFARELETHGPLWKPLQGGLFGGQPQRAEAAMTEFKQTFDRVAFNRF